MEPSRFPKYLRILRMLPENGMGHTEGCGILGALPDPRWMCLTCTGLGTQAPVNICTLSLTLDL